MAVISSAMSFPNWSFEKARPTSKASDDYSDDNRIRIRPDPADDVAPEQDAFQERYLSSEEDLSPMDSEFDDTISLGGEEPEIMEASVVRPVAVGRARIATMVSVQPARPMMVQIPQRQPVARPLRSSSLMRPISSIAGASVPLLKTPTPRRHQLATVHHASSPGSSPELEKTPEIPQRSPQRHYGPPQRTPTAPAFLERDPFADRTERSAPAHSMSRPRSMMRGLGRSLSISKKVVEPLRRTPTTESAPAVQPNHTPAKQPMVARDALDTHDYGTPRARRQLRRRRSTLSLIVV